MTTYFVGGEMDTLTPLDVFNIAETGSLSQGGYSRGGMYFSDRGARVAAYLINPASGVRSPATGTIWSHWCHYFADVTSNESGNPGRIYTLFNSSGVAIVRFISDNTTGQDGNGNYNGSNGWGMIQYFDGTNWNRVGQSFPTPQNNTLYYDLKLTIDATAGEVSFYNNGILSVSITGINTSSMVDVTRAEWQSGRGTNYFNGVIIASYNTIGHTIRVRPPGQNGSETGWNGNYTGISEFAVNDSDSISTPTPGVTSTFAGNNYSSTASGKVIKAVAVGCRVRTADDNGPKSLSAVLRINGTDYVSPHLGGVSQSITGSLAIWDKDPSTGNAWVDVTNVNGEFGVKSDT